MSPIQTSNKARGENARQHLNEHWCRESLVEMFFNVRSGRERRGWLGTEYHKVGICISRAEPYYDTVDAYNDGQTLIYICASLDLGMSSSRKWSSLSGSAFNEARAEVKGSMADGDTVRKAVQQVVDARRTTIVVMHSSRGTKPSEKIS